MNPEQSPSQAAPQPHNQKSPIWLIAGVVILIIVLAAFLWWFFVGRVAFTINGKVITNAQYNTMMAAASKNGVGKKDASAQYIEIEKRRAAANALKIEVTENQLQQNYRLLYRQADFFATTNDPWQLEKSYELALKNQLLVEKGGGYVGQVFVFPFSQLYEPRFVVAPEKLPQNWGSLSAITQNRDYAQQKTNDYHSKLQNKSITPEEVFKAIKNDPQLQFLAAANPSNDFTVNQNGVQYVNGSNDTSGQIVYYFSTIKQANKTGLTDVSTQSVTGLMQPPAGLGNPQTVAYYFANIENVVKPRPDVQKQFDDKLSKVVVVNHV